jgi:cytochrome b
MVQAWDVPTRLFHWTLVLLVGAAYFTHEFGDATLHLHRLTGYAILTLVLFRVLWGFVGSSTSRFAAFLRWPRHAFGYGLDLLWRRPRHYLGHNPAGSWIIVILLALVALQALAGLATSDDVRARGPLVRHVPERLVDSASTYHAYGFWILLGMVTVHVAANILYHVWKRDAVITSMVTGRKPALAYEDEPEARIAPAGRALLCLAVAALIVFGGVAVSGGSLLR